MMKLGLGLYPPLLTADNLRFARQAGAPHIVAHIPNMSCAAPARRYGLRPGLDESGHHDDRKRVLR